MILTALKGLTAILTDWWIDWNSGRCYSLAVSVGDQPPVHEHDASYTDRQASPDDFAVAGAEAIKQEIRHRRDAFSQHLASVLTQSLLLFLNRAPTPWCRLLVIYNSLQKLSVHNTRQVSGHVTRLARVRCILTYCTQVEYFSFIKLSVVIVMFCCVYGSTCTVCVCDMWYESLLSDICIPRRNLFVAQSLQSRA